MSTNMDKHTKSFDCIDSDIDQIAMQIESCQVKEDFMANSNNKMLDAQSALTSTGVVIYLRENGDVDYDFQHDLLCDPHVEQMKVSDLTRYLREVLNALEQNDQDATLDYSTIQKGVHLHD